MTAAGTLLNHGICMKLISEAAVCGRRKNSTLYCAILNLFYLHSNPRLYVYLKTDIAIV